jgi:plasmid maintenance system antidote protein VapI/Zn-dependent peptidase ImmA (M78 family)
MTSGSVELRPRWASPPSRTIATILESFGTDHNLQDLLQVDRATARALLNDSIQITPEIAQKLSQSLGSSPSFWTNRYRQYWDDLARLEADRWATQAPLEIFAGRNWVRRFDSWTERIQNLLEFFDVPDLEAWKDQYEPLLNQVKYRRHSSATQSDVAIAAWLKRAQMEARTLTLARYETATLSARIAQSRRLSRIKDPRDFISRLQELCAESGVALVLVKAPAGCPISGAAYSTEDGAPLVVLSGRYLSDDHLWYTFFHEIAHVLLHGNGKTFLDPLDEGRRDEPNDDEREANAWATSQILTEDLVEMCRNNRLTTRFIALIASKSGVAPGLIVGQLQHLGILQYNQLNRMKRRYEWSGSTMVAKGSQ